MIGSDDELKDLLGNKPEEEFHFDQKNWEKISAVLKKEKMRKRLPLYWSFIGLLFIGASAYYFLPLRSTNTSASLAEDPQLKTAQPKETQPVQIKQQAKKPAQKANSSPESPKKITLPEQRPSETPNAPVMANMPSQKVPPSIESVKTAKVLPALETKPETVAQNEKQTVTKQLPLTETLSNATGPEETRSEEPTASSPDVTTPVNELAVVSDNTLVPNEIKEPASPPLPQATVVQPPIATSIPEKNNDEIPPPPKIDSLTTAASAIKDSVKKNDMRSKLLFETGSNYLMGWKTNGKTEARGFNPLIGFTYYNVVAPRVALSMGLHYTLINNLSETSHTSYTRRVKFGEEADVTVISARQMHYITAPIKLNYDFDDRNTIHLGYTIGYLLNVDSRVETYTKGVGYQSESNISNAMGYRTGFNSFDGQFAMGYRRRLYGQLFVNGELLYGILDIKKNEVYKSTEFERTWGIKLSLGYNLLKK